MSEYANQVVYCTMANPKRLEEVKQAVAIMEPYVDRVVVVCNNSGKTDQWTPEQLAELHDLGAETYPRTWTNNFPEARNEYLNKCHYGDVVIGSDSDEHFCTDFARDIRNIVAEMQKDAVKRLRVNAHDITRPWVQRTNREYVSAELKSSHYKLLVFLYEPGMQYIGVGESGTVHESLVPGLEFRDLPDNYFYRHYKTEEEIWRRAARNVLISGGGNNVGERNAAWPILRELTKELGINKESDFFDYLEHGNIDSRLKQWLIDNRYEGLDFNHEMMEMFKYYFYVLHPEEKPEGIDVITELQPDSEADLVRFVERTYLDVFGRHADDQGKYQYTKQLMEKKITRKELADILTNSEEYKTKIKGAKTKVEQKTSPGSMEKIPLVNVPVLVEAQITPVIIEQILQHST